MTRELGRIPRAVLIVVAFAAITLALTWFWREYGRVGYGRFLRGVAPTIYDWIGFDGARVGAFRQRYINWIPFVGLVLVSPGLGWRRRFGGLLLGLLALFVSHLALNLTEATRGAGSLPIVPSMLSDALPFVLWIVVAFPVLRGWFATTLEPAPDEPTEESD